MFDQTPSNLAIALATAEGFCRLELFKEALAELDRLEIRDADETAAQLLRLRILTELEKWDAAAHLAETMADEGVWDAPVYLLGSLAIRQVKSTYEAEAFLLRSACHLQDDEHYHYLRACFACCRGDLIEAKAALGRAFYLDPALRFVAIDDPDLVHLWREI
jgi:hypothetical protein